MVADDGASALCMRAVSNLPYTMKSGETAYIHHLLAAPKPVNRTFVNRPKPTVAIDATKLYHEAVSKTKAEDVKWLAHELGVSVDSVATGTGVGAAWFQAYGAWGFPMRDGNYQTIGVRLRDDHGRKWAITGSKSGIFYPLVQTPKLAVICEGPTDTAAAISCGLFAIGRPSCSAGGDQIWDFIYHTKSIHDIVIIADNDEPGLRGAAALQEQVECPSCVITLPCKDMREFYKQGGNEATILSLVKNTKWVRPFER